MEPARVERRGAGYEARITIHAARARVFDELADPARHLGLQPLLVEVNPWPDGRGFQAVERVPILGGFGVRNRIEVAIETGDAGDTVRFHARTRGVEVHSRFELETRAVEPGTTRVVEWFQVDLPRWLSPIRGFVEGQAVGAQVRLLENLRNRLETPGGGP